MSTSHSQHDHHVTPLSQYFIVFGALLVLTVVTVAISFADLGEFALQAALVVAIAKASLVVIYFMHLKDADRFYTVIFLSSIFFFVLFIAFLMIDTQTRDFINPEENPKVWQQDNPRP